MRSLVELPDRLVFLYFHIFEYNIRKNTHGCLINRCRVCCPQTGQDPAIAAPKGQVSVDGNNRCANTYTPEKVLNVVVRHPDASI